MSSRYWIFERKGSCWLSFSSESVQWQQGIGATFIVVEVDGQLVRQGRLKVRSNFFDKPPRHYFYSRSRVDRFEAKRH
jgi:hypothetical protein